MNYISTSRLRTESSELINTLMRGGSVDLFHRSKLVGRITPVVVEEKPKKKDFYNFIMSLPKRKPTTIKEREKIYRQHLMKKYGKSLSGRK